MFAVPIIVTALPQDRTRPDRSRKLGWEQLGSPIRFTDDVSRVLNGKPAPSARLYDWDPGKPACGPNDGSIADAPGSGGGGRDAVTDTGTFACTQPATGADIAVTITGADSSLGRTPALGRSGRPLSADLVIFMSGVLRMWIFAADLRTAAAAGDPVTVRHNYTGLSVTSVSGQTNPPEPTTNNSTSFNHRVGGPPESSLTLSTHDGKPLGAKSNLPLVVPGSEYRAVVRLAADLVPFRRATICTTFDNRWQELATGAAANTGGAGGGPLEYAAAASDATPAALQRATCGDPDGPWYPRADQVPGGPAAVGKVRLISDVPAQQSMAMHVPLRAKTGPSGTRLRVFGHARAEEIDAGSWRHDTQKPEAAAGLLADSVTLTRIRTRIAIKVVDPGSTPQTTADQLVSVMAGKPVRFALYPTLTTAGTSAAAPIPVPVTVTVQLPASLTYEAADATVTSAINGTSPGAVHRPGRHGAPSTLTWVLPNRIPDQPIEPVEFDARGGERAPDVFLIAVHTSVSAPGDDSPEIHRSATRNLHMYIKGQGIAITLTTPQSQIFVGDSPTWTMIGRNSSFTTVPGVKLINVLPFQGDVRRPPSSFHGTIGLAGPVKAQPGTRAAYTSARPTAVRPDPGDPANQPGGTTPWCTAAGFGGRGCPASFAQVTAFRLDGIPTLQPGQRFSVTFKTAAHGAKHGDLWTDRWAARAAALRLPVQSADVPVRAIAGALSDLVWLDRNASGTVDPGEPGLPGVPVRLQCTDDRGRPLQQTNRTNTQGRSNFDALRPGNCTVRISNPDPRRYRFTNPAPSTPTHKQISRCDRKGNIAPVILRAVHGAADRPLTISVDRAADCGLTLLTPPKAKPRPALWIVNYADRELTRPNKTVRFTIKVTNTGNVALPHARLTDHFKHALRAARYRNDARTDTGRLSYKRGVLRWEGYLAPRKTATISYTIKVVKVPRGGNLRSVVTSPLKDTNCHRRPRWDNGCAVTVYVAPKGKLK